MPGPVVIWKAGATEVPWKGWQIAIFRNEPAKWSLEIAIEDGEPDWTPGDTSGYIQSLASASYTWTCEAYFPDESLDTWEDCPVFVQDDYQFSGDAEQNTAEVSGTDLTVLLTKPEDEFMADVDDDDSVDVLNEIFDEYGIDADVDTTAFDIQKMHRVGGPLDWVRQILEITQAWFYWEADQLKVKETTFPGTVAWALTDREDLKVISYRRNLGGVYNTVTVERTDAVSGISVVRVAKSGGDSLGTQFWNGLFDPPVYSARPFIDMKRGTIDTFVYKDAEDTILTGTQPAGSGMYFSATSPASSVSFIAEEGETAASEGPYTPQYEGYFLVTYGPPSGESPEDYSVTYADSADVALHGTLRPPRAINNALIGSAEVALLYAQRLIAEALRSYVTAEVQLLFNPHIKPGQTVSVTDAGAGLDNDLFMVENVYHTGNANSVLTRLELSRPAASE